MKCRPTPGGFELRLLNLFPLMITIMICIKEFTLVHLEHEIILGWKIFKKWQYPDYVLQFLSSTCTGSKIKGVSTILRFYAHITSRLKLVSSFSMM